MAGFYGILGETSVDTGRITSELVYTGREQRRTVTDTGVTVADVHRPEDDRRPVETNDGELMWVWGSVFGCDVGDQGYEPRPSGVTVSRYCANQYEWNGLESVAGLNGHFFGVLYNRTEGTVSFFNDRMGTIDVYYAKPTEDNLIFSSDLQSIERWPETEWSFDVDYLCEFFSYTRSMGVKTPLEGAFLVPPASIVTVDLDTIQCHTEQYWTPRHQPIGASFSYFVDEFVDRFRASLADRMAETGEYGLLMSGGSDSRLIVAALDDTEEVTAYHMANWMSREARTAERVALTAGVDFELLRRDDEHLSNELDRNPKLSNFQGMFNQANAEGFMPAIREDVDYLLSGLYADILFKGWGIPLWECSLGSIGTVAFPVRYPIESLEDYLDEWTKDIPQYVDWPRSMRDILEDNIFREGDQIYHHGVPYESPVELLVWSHVFPQTNMGGGFQIRSIRQHVPYRNPMLDNRLIDLSLSMPLKYFVRRDIIEAAIERLDPDLADIPHPDTGTPLNYSFPFDWISRYANSFWREIIRSEDPPRRDLGHGPWEPASDVIRTRDFVNETLSKHEQTIRTLPFLSWDGVRECYSNHLQGENHAQELFLLLTFLEMPLTERIASSTGDNE